MTVLDVVNLAVTSGLLGVLGKYIAKQGSGNILTRGFWKKEKYEDMMKLAIENNTKLYKELDYFRDKFDLRSVEVVEFHNGDYINKKSVQKYTMTFQMCRIGVKETKHLYQGTPLEDHYGLITLYKQSEVNVVLMDKDHIPKDAPPLMLEKMAQLGITGCIALGLFAHSEDLYPRAIVSCSLDDESKVQGLDVELNLHAEKFRQLILPKD